MNGIVLVLMASLCALSALGNLIWTVQGGKQKTAKECAYDVVSNTLMACALVVLAVSGA